MPLTDYYNHETGDEEETDLPDLPIDTPYPLSEWVVVKGRDGHKRHVLGEDYDGNWIAEFREGSSGECQVSVYPPGHNPEHGNLPTIGWTDESVEAAQQRFDRAIQQGEPPRADGGTPQNL